MRSRLVATLAASLMLLTAACGSEEPEVDVSSEVEPSEEATEDLGPSTHELGEKVDFSGDDGSEFNVTIEDYKRDTPHDDAVEAEQRVDALLIRACNISLDDDPYDSDLGTIINPFNFKLADDDDGEYEMLDLLPSPAPQPQLDTYSVIGQGDCKKGWLAFGVPKDVEFPTTTYSVDGGPVLAIWNLG